MLTGGTWPGSRCSGTPSVLHRSPTQRPESSVSSISHGVEGCSGCILYKRRTRAHACLFEAVRYFIFCAVRSTCLAPARSCTSRLKDFVPRCRRTTALTLSLEGSQTGPQTKTRSAFPPNSASLQACASHAGCMSSSQTVVTACLPIVFGVCVW